MNCPNCNQPTKPGAKFCGHCGTTIPEAVASLGCPSCGSPIKPNAKFCGGCGAALSQNPSPRDANPTTPAEANRPELEAVNGHLLWNLQPGVVGRVLSPQLLNHFSQARCLTIHPGTRALIFGDGVLVSEIPSGTIRFPTSSRPVNVPDREGGLLGTATGVGRFLSNLILGTPRQEQGQYPGRAQANQAVSSSRLLQVSLVREGAFPLVLEFPTVQTATLQTDVALQVMVEIPDAKAFHAAMLIDHTIVTSEAIAKLAQSILSDSIARFFRNLSPLDWSEGDSRLPQLATELQTSLTLTYGWARIVRVFNVAVENEALTRMRKLKEELYIAEQELEHLQARFDFENRLRLEENQRQISEAKDEQELNRQLQEINKDRLLTEDDLAKFQLLLLGERQIREAKSADEIQAALDTLRSSSLLREADLKELGTAIANRQEDQRIQRGHTLAMLDAQQQLELDRSRLTWESEIHDREIEQELERKRKDYLAQVQFETLKIQAQRQQDSYSDERRKADLDIDHQEMLAQLELARQAQALTESGKEADHARELALRQQQLAHETEMRTILKEMSVEQIMAANPDITPDAARALAERFKSEGALSAADQRVAMAMEQKEEMKAFMSEQMVTMQQMMRDMMASNAQIAGGIIKDKQEQIQTASQNSERGADRAVDLVGRTAQSISGALTRNTSSICQKCGKPIMAKFCEECGPA